MFKINKTITIILILILSFYTEVYAGTVIKQSPPLKQEYSWSKNMNMAADTLNTVTSNKGILIAAGTDGIIKTSTDGVNWTVQKSKTINCLNGICSNGQLYVAVGGQGTIITSTDGISWTLRTSGVPGSLNGVSWCNDSFIAAGDRGIILKSKDGVQWVKINNIPVSKNLYTIACSGKKFIAAGEEGTILVSGDGSSWSDKSMDTPVSFYDMVWNGKIFVAAGYGGSAYYNGSNVMMISSADGIKWNQKVYEFRDTRSKAKGLCWDGKKFVAVGGCYAYTSKDGFAWDILINIVDESLSDIVWNGRKFVAVGNYGATYTSVSGATWDKNTISGIKGNILSLGSNGSSYVLVARPGFGQVFTSSDGINWNEAEAVRGKAFYNRVIWYKNQYVITGNSGTVLTSPDGKSWNNYKAMSDYDYQDITTRNKVMIGAQGLQGISSKIIYSEDGLNWKPAESKDGEGFYRFGYNGKLIVAVGDKGVIQSSEDGKVWITRKSAIVNNLKDVAFNGKILVTVGQKGSVAVSADGVNWESVSSKTEDDLNSITWTGDKFLAAGSNGALLSSKDGLTWIPIYSGTTNHILTVLWDGKKVMLGGENGLLMTGTPK